MSDFLVILGKRESRTFNLDDNEEKELNITMNKVNGEWDVAKLADVLDSLKKEGVDLGIQLHEKYYEEMFKATPDMELVDVYIDITGNKNIWKRPGMLQLIKDCQNKKVNCIATQTKAYLAANTEDFFFIMDR